MNNYRKIPFFLKILVYPEMRKPPSTRYAEEMIIANLMFQIGLLDPFKTFIFWAKFVTDLL